MMKTMMVVLLATGAWLGVSGDRTVDKSAADHNAKTANIEMPPTSVVAVGWHGLTESGRGASSSYHGLAARDRATQILPVPDFAPPPA